MSIVNLSPADIKSLLDAGKIVLVDVREPAEYKSERIAGALLMPLSSFDPKALPAPDESRPVVFHCGKGGRSAKAVELCLAANLAHTRHMAGGFQAWRAAGFPILRLDPASGQVCSIC